MASSADDGPAFDDEIHLWREDDRWIANDADTGVTTLASPVRTPWSRVPLLVES